PTSVQAATSRARDSGRTTVRSATSSAPRVVSSSRGCRTATRNSLQVRPRGLGPAAPATPQTQPHVDQAHARQRRDLVERHPAHVVRRAVRLHAHVPRHDAALVDEAQRVERPPGLAGQTVLGAEVEAVRAQEPGQLYDVTGLLERLAHGGRLGVLAGLQPAAGQGPAGLEPAGDLALALLYDPMG